VEYVRTICVALGMASVEQHLSGSILQRGAMRGLALPPGYCVWSVSKACGIVGGGVPLPHLRGPRAQGLDPTAVASANTGSGSGSAPTFGDGDWDWTRLDTVCTLEEPAFVVSGGRVA
jgi:hypothetical protein